VLVAGQPDEAHRGLGEQPERRVRHAEAGAQYRYQQRRVGQPGALGEAYRRGDWVVVDRHLTGRLVDQHGGQLVQGGPEVRRIGALVAHDRESGLRERMIYHEYVHGSHGNQDHG
jgi:hypothetical protein